MADVSQLTLPDGITYDIKDTVARSMGTVVPATNTPLMDGTGAVGTSVKYAREDHVHPSDTSKQDTLISGTNIKTVNHNSLLGSGNVNAIYFGIVDGTSTATAFTASIAGIPYYYDGLTVVLKNGVITSASGFKININGIGAKPVYTNLAAATAETTKFNINYTMMFIYDSSRIAGGAWLCYNGYDSNTNTIGYQLRTNSSPRPAVDTGYRYRLWFTALDGQGWCPANTSTSTNATAVRTPNTRTIDPFGDIVYNAYNGTVTSGSNLSTGTCWTQYTLSLGYSFNTTGSALTLTYPAPVYVKATPQTGGGVKIDGYVQALPTTEDGKVYIFLGMAYSATNVELFPNHPVYYYSHGAIRLWTNQDMTKPYDYYDDSTAATGGALLGLVSSNTAENLSTAGGANADAVGSYSSAFGTYVRAEGSGAHAEGHGTSSQDTLASGDGSHAEGRRTTASGNYSHAEGSDTVASSIASHAEGGIDPYGNVGTVTASGNSSHAEGVNTTASGHASHAEGNNTIASSFESHAEGWDTVSSAAASHAEGYGTIANGRSQHVFGDFNVADTANSTSRNTYVEIVGNGTDANNRSNIRTMKWDGDQKNYGRIFTSFKDAVAIGSLEATSTTVPNLVAELRVSSGAMGSVNISTAYTNGNITIATGWYNFIYVPHRNGGKNGGDNPDAGQGDNSKYGTLLLCGMTVAGEAFYRIRINGGSITSVTQITERGTVGTIVSGIGTAVSIASGTSNKEFGSFSLTPGVWQINLCVKYASNSNGRRFAHLSTSNAGASISDNWCAQCAPVNGGSTWMHWGACLNVTTNTTYHLVGYQNSNSTLSVTPMWDCVKVG